MLGTDAVVVLSALLTFDVEVFDAVLELAGALESNVGVTDVAVEFREALGVMSVGIVSLVGRSLETGEMWVDVVREALEVRETGILLVEAVVIFLAMLEIKEA